MPNEPVTKKEVRELDDMDRTRGGATLTTWQKSFLKILRATPSVKAACRAAKVSRQTAYNHRKGNAEFAAQWADAIEHSVDELEAVAFKLATEGDSSLISFLLRAYRPERFNPTQRLEVDARHVGVILLPEKESKEP